MARPLFSFEFFPPKTPEGASKLSEVRSQLAALHPRFFSVTYGAGGSTRDYSMATVLDIRQAGLDAAPHLSCIGASRDSLRSVLAEYQQHQIRHIIALRGDLPSGMASGGEFRYASDLVAFIREETGDWFNIEVAAYPEVHPQAQSAEEDLRHFKTKIDAGANAAITQYFFNADAYFAFVEECLGLGITAPIIPGIMPIANYAQLARFSDACGAEIPRWVRKRLEGYHDDLDSIRAFGLDLITDLSARMLQQGAPGLHIYTMNQSAVTLELWRRLGLNT
ncbi:MAG: methylenetetrahydrofolate reductase [NAD(P)H] [Betaproteobacteria bacterium]|nr:methylenetetrahydrofolate reductase [NAD(P)H] [Betaproteobacteria bacterium]